MGLLFTMLYIVTAYLGPDTVFGLELAQYHIEIVIVVIALLLSLPSASGSRVLSSVQALAIAGLCFSVACSMIFNGWIGGGPKMLMQFLPDVMSFFLIVMNCRKKWHIQALVLAVLFVAVFNVMAASRALAAGDMTSKYVLMQVTSETSQTYIPRIKGTSFLGDPNDFAQMMVSLIPCMFLFWKKGSSARNLLMVYAPVGFLILGMYLTHSRGGMVALMAVAIVAGRKRIGIFPAVMIGLVLFAGLTVVGFSGGRDVSAGEDRMAAWSVGLMLVRSHPVFGVGFEKFGDFNDITAHNTFVVCAAELGLIGVFCWILLMLVTIRDVLVAAVDPNAPVKKKRDDRLPYGRPRSEDEETPARTAASLAPAAFAATPALRTAGRAGALAFAGGVPATAGETALRYPADIRFGKSGGSELSGVSGVGDDSDVSDAELRRMCALMVVMFAGFLTAGWFLSRAYTMCLYVNAGMAAAVYGMARERGIAPAPMELGRAMKITGWLVVGLLIGVYIIVRLDHLVPH